MNTAAAGLQGIRGQGTPDQPVPAISKTGHRDEFSGFPPLSEGKTGAPTLWSVFF
jgi:hypothetical protein